MSVHYRRGHWTRANGSEARAAVETFTPDVVILDLHMPGGSGLEVLRDLKREPHAPLVVMCTGRPDPGCRRQCLDAGADFFMDELADLDQWDHLLTTLG